MKPRFATGRNSKSAERFLYIRSAVKAWDLDKPASILSKSQPCSSPVIASGVDYRVDPEGCQLPEKGVVSPDELLSALRRYLAESGDTEEAVASQIGVNHHTLRRWLSDRQSPKKGRLVLAASFLRHAGYL
jgi:hypothetical protein